MARRCSLAAWLGHPQLISDPLKADQRQETEDGLILHRLAKFFLSGGNDTHYTIIPDDYTPPPHFFTNLKKFFVEELPKIRKMIGDPHELLPELRLSVDDRLRPTYGYPNGYFVGSLDLALYNPDTQALIVLDYKTERRTDVDFSDYYRAQLALYTLLVHYAYAPVSKYRLGIYAVAPGEMRWLDEEWVDFDANIAVQSLIDLINEALENLKEIKPTENHLCVYCSYREQCPLFTEE